MAGLTRTDGGLFLWPSIREKGPPLSVRPSLCLFRGNRRLDLHFGALEVAAARKILLRIDQTGLWPFVCGFKGK